MTFEQTLEVVAKKLISYGFDATVEYPGYVSIPINRGDSLYPEPHFWSIGTANGPWGFDVHLKDGTNLEEPCGDSPFPQEDAVPDAIVFWILKEIVTFYL